MGTADTHGWPPRAACARGCRGTSGIFSKRALAGLWQGRALAGPLDHTCLPAGSFAQPTPCLPLFPLRQPCQLAPAPSSYPSTLSHTASGLSFPLLHHSPSPAALALASPQPPQACLVRHWKCLSPVSRLCHPLCFPEGMENGEFIEIPTLCL